MGAYRVMILNGNYAHRLSYFTGLLRKAREDFPELSEDAVEVVQYGGTRRKHMYGIEFTVMAIPLVGYVRVLEPEPIL